MGFQLVIAEGKESGREFAFDQLEVVIGRTSECDVILYESGVSRRHARIFADGPAFFIEDLGSSNGTKVNGSAVSKHELKEGDAIALGPVLFNFKPVELEPAATSGSDDPGAGNHTRVVSVAELQKSRNRGVVSMPQGASQQDLEAITGRGTSQLPAIKPSRPAAGPSGVVKRPRAPLADRDEDLPEGVSVAGGGRAAMSRPSGEKKAQISAADRARLKRQGTRGEATLWWREASTVKRALVVLAATVLVGGPVGGVIYALMPEPKAKVIEPTVLGSEALSASFGLGDGVTFERADEKSFDFSVNSPVQVMAVLHYQSKDIGSKDEVSISVNGTEVGWLSPDTLDSNERTYELLVPTTLIKRNEPNTFTFDNVRNPPDGDKWRIWNVWVETAVLPEKDEEGLVADAQDKFRKGLQKWDQRDIGAVNRWDAYKYFREAWLTMEAMPTRSRPPIYQIAREKMRESRNDLDLKCRNLLLEARTAYSLNQYDKALAALKQVDDFFPSKNHPCHARAENDRNQYGL
jgi:FHA domain